MADYIDDILKELDSISNENESIIAPKEPERPKIELTRSGVQTRDDGLQYEDIPFSTLFWEPEHVPDHLCRVYQGLEGVPEINGSYMPPKKEIEMISVSWSQMLKVLTVGPTGCGKTMMFEFLASKLGRPYLRIEHNVFFSDEKVFGQTHINITEEGKTETDFIEGTLPRSMDLPTIVLLDETSRNVGTANILYQRLLDRRELSMTEVKGGSGVKAAHDDWIICAADNTKGNGDDMDKYSASNVQDQAFINRLDIILDADYLSQKEEKLLIQSLSPEMPSDLAEGLAKFSKLMHNGFKSGEILTAFSPRNLEAICRLYNSQVDLALALEMNYISRVSKSEVSDVRESARAVFG